MRNNLWIGSGISGMGGIPMLGTGARGLTYLIREIFRNGAQGFAYDPNDLTEEKINWRKNQLLNTEDFTYGASSNFTVVKEADGWALTATAQSVTGYSLLGVQYPIGAASDSRGAGTVVRSIEVKKGTGVFRLGAASNSTALFVNADTMTAIDPPTGLPYTITAIGSDWYRIETFFYSSSLGSSTLSNTFGWSTTKATSSTLDTTTQVGTVTRVRNPSFAFVPFETTKSIPYQAITDFNSDFIKQFPLHTLYQDASGTIPVTASGQPVGLMLDKSKGLVLGSNQISYPNSEELPASVNMGDAVSTWALNTNAPISGTQDGRLIVTVPSSFSSRPSLTFLCSSPLVPNRLYKFSFRYKVNSGAPRLAQMHTGNGTYTITPDKGLLQGSGTFDILMRWDGVSQTRPYMYFSNESVFDLQIDDISVREVKGNHAYQTVSASRPILRQNATTGANYLEFDGTDDYFIVANGNLKFLHDGTGATGFVGFKPSGAAVYHALLNTGDLGSSNRVGYALSQDDRVGNGYILNIVAKGSSPLHISNAYTSGVSTNPRVISFKNKIGTHVLRLNGTEVFNSSTETSVPNPAESTNDLWIGRAPAGFGLHGNLYGLVCIARLTTDSETLALEKAIAKNTGVTLNV